VTRVDLLIGLLGAYFALGIFVSAWRRETESIGGVAAWVALSGLWAIAAHNRWGTSDPGAAIGVGLGWGAVAYLLTLCGAWLGRRGPARAWVWLLGPVHAAGLAGIWLLEGRKRRAGGKSRAVEEMMALPAAGAAQDGEAASQVLESVIELGRTTVDTVMVPRSEIAALPETATVGDWLSLARSSRHPYLPVYRTELDEVLGYVRVNDLLSAADPRLPVKDFLREARFVPETMRCDDLLRELISHGERFAIVVDEFGGTAGLVRDADLFEILLGEIDQETAAGSEVTEVARGIFLVRGQCRLDDFNETFPRPLPAGDYETVGGLLLARLGRVPVTGEALEIDGIRLEVLASTPRRILRLRVMLAAAAAAGRPGAG